jgi:hypothetical protein
MDKIKLNYDHFAIQIEDGKKYLGPYRSWREADIARKYVDGTVFIVKCTGIGELQPFERSDGTFIDLGTVKNPKPMDYSAPLTFPVKAAPSISVEAADDVVGAPIISPVPEEPQRQSGQVTYTAEHAKVDAGAEERVKRQEEHVKKFGIAMAPPIYAPGFVTEKLGGENFTISHRKHNEMPRTSEGLRGIRDAVANEKRADLVVRPNLLRMTDNGQLYRLNGVRDKEGKPKTILLEQNGIRQIAARMNEQFPRAAEFLSVLDPVDRAYVFNKQIEKVDPEAEIKLRTRVTETGDRAIYAVVGKSYSVFDADRIADLLVEPFSKLDKVFGAENAPRGMALYKPDDSSMRVDAIWHADSIVNLAAGDVFKAGLRFRSSDSGGGSIKADLLVWRNLCKNLIIIDKASVEVLRRTHRGSMEGISVDLTAATAKAEEFIKGFANDWGFLRNAPIGKVEIYGERYETVPMALKALVDQGRIDGLTATNAAVEALLNGYAAEPGNGSLADIINAVTRAANSSKFDFEKQEKIEKAAGELVPVLVKAAHRALD